MYIGPVNFEKVRNFMLAITEKLKLYDGQSRVGIVTFSGRATIERYLREPANKDDIFAAINGIVYDGDYPFTADAFALLIERVFTPESGDRSDVPNFAILITGGLLFSEFTLPLAYRAQEQGIHVFGIGIGLSVSDQLELNMIASDPNELNAYNQPNVARLNDMSTKLWQLSVKVCSKSELVISILFERRHFAMRLNTVAML